MAEHRTTYQLLADIYGYQPSHPWFYRRSGRVMPLRTILEHTKETGYLGYRAEDIRKASAGGNREAKLLELRDAVCVELKRDILRFREIRRKFMGLSRAGETDSDRYIDLCTDMSLKHNHIYNGFAHLISIDGLSFQPSLF